MQQDTPEVGHAVTAIAIAKCQRWQPVVRLIRRAIEHGHGVGGRQSYNLAIGRCSARLPAEGQDGGGVSNLNTSNFSKTLK